MGVCERRLGHEIHRPAEQRFRCRAQAKIRSCIGTRRHRLELDQQIHVASCGIGIAGCSRAEEIEPAHTKFTTEIVERAPIEIDRANPAIPPITYPRVIFVHKKNDNTCHRVVRLRDYARRTIEMPSPVVLVAESIPGMQPWCSTSFGSRSRGAALCRPRPVPSDGCSPRHRPPGWRRAGVRPALRSTCPPGDPVRPSILRRFGGFRYMLNPPYTGGTL